MTEPPFAPWYGPGGWMVGELPVGRWGCRGEAPARLPERWSRGPDGPGEAMPTDFELECFVHLVAHELARVGGTEWMMLSAGCLLPWEPPPCEAQAAAAAGESLIPWCPGLSWFWPSEDRGKPFR